MAANAGRAGSPLRSPFGQLGNANRTAMGRLFPPGPLHTVDDAEYTTMQWIDWYNNRRPHSQLNYIPPDEYETASCARTLASQRRRLNHEAGIKPETVHTARLPGARAHRFLYWSMF